MLQEQYRAIMQYSIPKDVCANSEKPPSHKASADWFCIKVTNQITVTIINTHHFYFFSVALKISKGETTASNATRPEWKVKKGEAEVTKFAHTQQKVSDRSVVTCPKHQMDRGKFKICRLSNVDTLSHDLLYYNRPVQKCNLRDPRRALVYGRFLGILFILSFSRSNDIRI
jgi:hypothetical protein